MAVLSAADTHIQMAPRVIPAVGVLGVKRLIRLQPVPVPPLAPYVCPSTKTVARLIGDAADAVVQEGPKADYSPEARLSTRAPE
jgi:hypothetical protein